MPSIVEEWLDAPGGGPARGIAAVSTDWRSSRYDGGMSRSRAGALCLLLICLGCKPVPGEIVLETDTDFVPGVELGRLEWAVEGPSGPLEPTPALDLDDTAPEPPYTLTLIAPPTDPNASIRVTARAFAPGATEGDPPLVTMTREAVFEPSQRRVLRFDLSRLCIGVTCEPAEHCVPQGPTVTCRAEDDGFDTLPSYRDDRAWSDTELCNGRDDNGDGDIDEGFAFSSNPEHCGGCFVVCEDVVGDGAHPICRARECEQECDELQADCDGDPANGCETNLREPETCGACDAPCDPSAPLCEVSEGLARCVAECSDPTLRSCDDRCVDTQTDLQHCGECNRACPDAMLGAARCIEGECTPRCDPNAHACDGICLSDDSIGSCGTRCDPCEAAPMGTGADAGVTCDNGACTLQCDEGRFDCDGDPTNGCESVAMGDDPRNCGGCGVDCGTGTCSAGECSTAVIQFSVGPSHTCARLADGTIRCWGDNDHAQLGTGVAGSPEPRPVLVTALPGVMPTPGGAVQMQPAQLDEDTTYVLEASATALPLGGTITSFRLFLLGRDPRLPDMAPDAVTPVLVTPLGLSNRFAARGGSVLIARQDVIMNQWALAGLGAQRFEAFSTFDDPHAPDGRIDHTLLRTYGHGLADPIEVFRGERESCVQRPLFAMGTNPILECWGVEEMGLPVFIGRAGGSRTAQRVMPAGRGRLDATVPPALGYQAGCAAFSEIIGGVPQPSTYHCWGDWDCGGFGAAPTPVTSSLTASAMPRLSVGRSAACAVAAPDDRIVCWGDDLQGTCHPTATELDTRSIGPVRDARRVALSRSHGCFLRRAGGGTLYCWGSNDRGQLGTGAGSGSHPPAQVLF